MPENRYPPEICLPNYHPDRMVVRYFGIPSSTIKKITELMSKNPLQFWLELSPNGLHFVVNVDNQLIDTFFSRKQVDFPEGLSPFVVNLVGFGGLDRWKGCEDRKNGEYCLVFERPEEDEKVQCVPKWIMSLIVLESHNSASLEGWFGSDLETEFPHSPDSCSSSSLSQDSESSSGDAGKDLSPALKECSMIEIGVEVEEDGHNPIDLDDFRPVCSFALNSVKEWASIVSVSESFYLMVTKDYGIGILPHMVTGCDLHTPFRIIPGERSSSKLVIPHVDSFHGVSVLLSREIATVLSKNSSNDTVYSVTIFADSTFSQMWLVFQQGDLCPEKDLFFKKDFLGCSGTQLPKNRQTTRIVGLHQPETIEGSRSSHPSFFLLDNGDVESVNEMEESAEKALKDFIRNIQTIQNRDKRLKRKRVFSEC